MDQQQTGSDIFTDSIDDIISILNRHEVLPIKNVALPSKRKEETYPYEDQECIIDSQEKKFNAISVNSKYLFQPLTQLRPPRSNPSQIRAQQSTMIPPLKNRQSSSNKESRSVKLNNVSLNEITVGIRYLTFKPYSGNTVDKIIDSGYYIKFCNGTIKLIKGFFEENGFKETNDKNWTVYWSTGPVKHDIYFNLFAYQKVCHFPKSYEMTRKDLMHRNISKMQIDHGLSNFNFIPKTYILPAEMSFFLEEHEKIKNSGVVYICKPHASSQGRGIFITDKIQEILSRQNSNNSYVVSHYIQNPMLINNLKFDMRIYVALTCINPLRIYVYEDGLARFATGNYTTELQKGNRFVHLTNYSVNKESPNFVANADPSLDHVGSKWSLLSLKEYLKLNGINEQAIFERIDDMIVKTVLSVESIIFQACEHNVPFRSNCFSLFGFDVLIDQNLKPWLLEVNLSPSLNIDAPIDLKIKGDMIADLFTMVGIVPLVNKNKKNNDQRFANDGYIKNSNAFAQDKQSSLSINQNGQQQTGFEKYIIKESEDELKRGRKWKRVFPNENSYRYKNFFEQDRALNAVMRNHELSKMQQAKNQQTSNTQMNASFQRKQGLNHTFINAAKSKLGA